MFAKRFGLKREVARPSAVTVTSRGIETLEGRCLMSAALYSSGGETDVPAAHVTLKAAPTIALPGGGATSFLKMAPA